MDLESWREEIGPALEAAWAGTVQNPAWRLECLPGDTPVSGAVVRAAHRRWFEGRVVEVVTASGRQFSATPNHPMLTRRGWVPAGALRQGDNLVRYGGHENARALGNDHEATPPTTIAQVFDALAQLRPPERVQAVRLDFHGDGRDGDVDVARAAGDLCLGRFAPIREPLEDQVFETPAASRTRFCHECGHLVMITQRCGVCDAPVRGPRTAQDALDGGVARTKRLGELIRAFSALVPSGYLVLREIMALAGGRAAASEMKLPRRGQRARDPRFTDYSTDPAARGADDGRDVRDALAMEVEFERVSSCRDVEFRGHVYNLSTAHGYFTIAGGLYTGNTIFRTNVQTAFSHGRVRQMRDPAVTALRPFWLYDAITDGRQTDICDARDGVLLPADDPWWLNNTPPLHFNALESEALVLTSAGLRPIRSLSVGDSVATTRGRYRPVTAILHKIVANATVREIRLESGRVLRGTHEHPVACRAPLGRPIWKRLGDIKVGDQILQYQRQPSGGADAVGCHPHDGPPLLAEPSITGSVRGTPGLGMVALPIDFEGNPMLREGEVEDVGSYWMLGGSRREDGTDVLLSWGEVAAVGAADGSGSSFHHPGHRGGIHRHHAGGDVRSSEPPGPVTLAATLRDHLRAAARDGNLLPLRAHLDAVAPAPAREDGLPEAMLALDLADALASFPVLDHNKSLNCTTVADVYSHASAVITIADACKPAWLCDISVEEDETYFANGIAVHNCRSGIRSLRKAQADRRGGVNPPDREVELSPPGAGFGAAPSLDPAVQVAPFVHEPTGDPALEGARLRKEASRRSA